jgi:pimeloyl-ACP methyl ester carboxylesterase
MSPAAAPEKATGGQSDRHRRHLWRRARCTIKKRTFFTTGAVAAATASAAALVAARRSGLGEDLDWEAVDKGGRIVRVDGYGVHCVLEGEGPAIVLIHGFGGNIFSYRNVIPLLARDHRVIAVDLKGCGYSERDAHAGLSHRDQVAMLKGLLDKLGVERAAFVGHSLGGAVAQRFAATYPQVVDALVLVASATGDERWGEYLGRFVPPGFLLRPLVSALVGLTTAAAYALQHGVAAQDFVGKFSHMRFVSRRLLRLWTYDAATLTDDVCDGYLRPMRIRGTLASILISVRETERDDAIERSRITMPVLLLYAADDRAVPLSAAHRLHELLPQARLVVMDRAAHLLMEERPEECVRVIAGFLRDAGAPPSAGPVTET